MSDGFEMVNVHRENIVKKQKNQCRPLPVKFTKVLTLYDTIPSLNDPQKEEFEKKLR